MLRFGPPGQRYGILLPLRCFISDQPGPTDFESSCLSSELLSAARRTFSKSALVCVVILTLTRCI
nr:MAG TPA_asm: hypothetical protein [Caudoviricetes sp.]